SAALIRIGEEVPMPDMKRREFIALLGGGGLLLAVKVRRARGQQPAVPVVGFLNFASGEGYRPMTAAFRRGLQESGYVEGRNVAIEYRWAEGRIDRLPALAAEVGDRRGGESGARPTPGAVPAKALNTRNT